MANDCGDFWDDDIDDELLAKATQIAEKRAEEERKAAERAKFDLNPEEIAEITKMMEDDDDDDWLHNPVPSRRNQENRQKQSHIGLKIEDFEFQPPPIRDPPIKSNYSTISSGFQAVTREPSEIEKLKEELKKVKVTAKKLQEETYQKNGEISFLRSELQKTEAEVENERREKRFQLLAKEEEFKLLEKRLKGNINQLETDNAFLKEDLRKVHDRNKKQTTVIPVTTKLVKRPMDPLTTPSPKRKKYIPRGMDESFFESDKKSGPCNIPLIDKQVQTNQNPKWRRKHRLTLRCHDHGKLSSWTWIP